MAKRPQRRRHVPQRTCVACRVSRPKRELVRIVRTPEGVVMADDTGRRSGRGAYLCRQRDCWETALARRQLAHALKVPLTAETQAQTICRRVNSALDLCARVVQAPQIGALSLCVRTILGRLKKPLGRNPLIAGRFRLAC